MSLNKIDQAKKRINSINWKYNDPHKEGSHMLLFKEFLRRAALLAELFEILDVPGTGWPMLNYATYFDSSLELEDEEIDALAEELHVGGFPFWYSSRVCIYFIHWIIIQDRPEVVAVNIPNPYEPLLTLYERGGTFQRDKDGTWEFSFTAFFIGSSSSHVSSIPVIELDETSLENVEKEFERNRQEVMAKQRA